MGLDLKEKAIKYLLESGFVSAYVKKLMFNTDIDNLYNDYLNEAWLAILEQKDDLWLKLYNSAIKKGKDFEYELRNYISVVIRNTVHSNSSNAYKKLKRHRTTEYTKDNDLWQFYANTIADEKDIYEQIKDNQYEISES